ncbi:Interleukin-17 Receptor A [Manis pentadactyla]|nr:Interleukin-17 Receptor A [Manis pentadactyla]
MFWTQKSSNQRQLKRSQEETLQIFCYCCSCLQEIPGPWLWLCVQAPNYLTSSLRRITDLPVPAPVSWNHVSALEGNNTAISPGWRGQEEGRYTLLRPKSCCCTEAK